MNPVYIETLVYQPSIYRNSQCVSEPPRGRVSAELSKPVERKGAMCVVLV